MSEPPNYQIEETRAEIWHRKMRCRFCAEGYMVATGAGFSYDTDPPMHQWDHICSNDICGAKEAFTVQYPHFVQRAKGDR